MPLPFVAGDDDLLDHVRGVVDKEASDIGDVVSLVVVEGKSVEVAAGLFEVVDYLGSHVDKRQRHVGRRCGAARDGGH